MYVNKILVGYVLKCFQYIIGKLIIIIIIIFKCLNIKVIGYLNIYWFAWDG